MTTMMVVVVVMLMTKLTMVLTLMMMMMRTAYVGEWSEFLATDPEVPGLSPGATRFSEK
jgi:hypothetical protein